MFPKFIAVMFYLFILLLMIFQGPFSNFFVGVSVFVFDFNVYVIRFNVGIIPAVFFTRQSTIPIHQLQPKNIGVWLRQVDKT